MPENRSGGAALVAVQPGTGSKRMRLNDMAFSPWFCTCTSKNTLCRSVGDSDADAVWAEGECALVLTDSGFDTCDIRKSTFYLYLS